MHLFVAFDNDLSREIAVTDYTTVKLDDGITGSPIDLFALDGVRGLYLVRSDGTETLTGSDPVMSPEEFARSVGWCSPEEKQALVDRVGELEQQLNVKARAVDQLEQEAARVGSQERGAAGVAKKRS